MVILRGFWNTQNQQFFEKSKNHPTYVLDYLMIFPNLDKV